VARRITIRFAVVCGLDLLATAGRANAAEPSALVYEASPSCPDRSAFVSAIRARTNEWSEAETASRKFIVHVALGDDRQSRGTLVIANGGKTGAPRVVDATTCAEAVQALSFIAALAIDPYAKAPPAPGAGEASSPAGSSPDTSAAPLATAAAPPVKLAAPAAESAVPPAATSSPERTVSWSAGISADVLGYAAPGAVVGAGFFVGFRPIPRLDLRLSVHQTLPTTVVAEATSTSLTWTTGRFEPCVGVLHSETLDLAPCLFVEVGRLAADGGGVDKTQQASTAWAAGGAAARSELALGQVVRLELEGGLFVPFGRSEITYRPAFVAYRPPAAGALLSLGAVARWH
jgi:hypothetical protein